MNLSSRGMSALPKWFIMLVVLTLTAFAGPPPKSNAPAPHASAPSRPAASAPHSAPAQRPGGGANTAQRPSPNGMNNRGPGANTANRPGGAANNRGPMGGNKPGQMGGNKSGQGLGNKGGQAAGNKPGQMGGNKSGQMGGNKGGQMAGNKPGGAGGNAHKYEPKGSTTHTTKGGNTVSVRKNGQVRTIQTKSGMKINHGLHGERRISSTHNGRTVVSMGRHGGYSQRAYYSRGGTTYVQRTYYYGGNYYAYGYSSYYYGGYPYYGYAPAYYYGPAYYGWAYNPWPAPVTYGWGWGGAPWYGYYGPYWQPYPVYPTAAFWLTDYLLSAQLQAAYAAQAEAAESGQAVPPEIERRIQNASADEIAALWSTDPLVASNLEAAYGPFLLGAAAPAAKGGATQMSPEVKQALADEMKKEIAAEKDAAAGGTQTASKDKVPAALDPNTRYFVVSSALDLTTSDGVECALTPGDVIYRTGDQPDDDHMVDATVKSSKKDECAMGATVGVEVGDIQEMHNQLRIQMDAGLKELASKQGKNGLPAAPDTTTKAGEVPAPTPDKGVESDLKAQQQEADQAEADAKQQN